MARDFFNNLPNTTTPLTAPRLNALLDGDEAMGNIVVDSIRSKNMFDEKQLLNASGWSKNSSGYYNGSLTNFYLEFRDGFHIGETFKANTQYTFSANAYVEGGQALFAFIYTDNTEEYLGINNTSASNLSFTTQANKTLSKIAGTYGYGDTEKLFIKNIQLEEGTTATSYSQYQNLDTQIIPIIPTFTSSVSSNDLDYECVRIKNYVFLKLNTIVFNISGSTHDETFITGLPRPDRIHIFLLNTGWSNMANDSLLRFKILQDGTIKSHYALLNAGSDISSGILIYRTTD